MEFVIGIFLFFLFLFFRDIKPQNVLIDPEDCTLKVCDFGCAKRLVKGEPNIDYICSRYYRPPELVLGNQNYTTQVDVWSMGCVIAELVLCQPIFPGNSSTNQMMEIINILGTPSHEQILIMNPKGSKIKMPNKPKIEWSEILAEKFNDSNFIDLVSKLLVYEPNLRLTPYKAMCHPFFDDLRKENAKLPNGSPLPHHLFEFKKCERDFDKKSIDYLITKIK